MSLNFSIGRIYNFDKITGIGFQASKWEEYTISNEIDFVIISQPYFTSLNDLYK